MRRAYEIWRPRKDARSIVRDADAICRSYAEAGRSLTLRQLYYQFVSRDLIPNSEASYERLGSIINNARMAGMLDWRHIVDRGRSLRGTSHWSDPAEIIDAVAQQFRIDKWTTQPRRVEVWIEKEALAEVAENAARKWDVNWFACKGYVSQSEQWQAGRRIGGYLADGQAVTILHLGDHDPSGIDMTRDITDRLETFLVHDWAHDNPDVVAEDDGFDREKIWEAMAERVDDDKPFVVNRIALNRDQIRRYNPPPNPAKLTDSRATSYIAEHGYQSWELDALDPETLENLIEAHIEEIVDLDLWNSQVAVEAEHRRLLGAASRQWPSLSAGLGGAR